jgi:MFS family permease
MLSNSPPSPPGYVELLRANPNFRNLWFGQIVSQLGDWFDTIAVFTLIFQLTHSAETAGLLTLARFLPSVFIGPTAGVVVDRVNRKRLLICTDLLRAVIVLGFLFARRPDQVWLIYVITIFQFGVSSFFEPAKNAILPTLTQSHDLVAANALSAMTWSTMLTLGGAIGGAVTHYFGWETAFVVDSLTFLLSAAFLSRIRMEKELERVRHPFSWGRATGILDIREGLRYLKAHRSVRLLLFIKPVWSLSVGGLVLMLTLMGDRIFRIGHDASAGISILYTARGIGTALGPVLTRRIAGHDPTKMRHALGPAFVVGGAFYLLISVSPNIWLAALATLCAHMGGSVLWVFSTVLLQQTTSNEYRGRVFATELMAQTLTLSLSTYLSSYAVDHLHVGIRSVVAVLAGFTILAAASWGWLNRENESVIPTG